MLLCSPEFTHVLLLHVPASLRIFSLIHFIFKENLGYFDIIESLTQNLYSQIASLKFIYTEKVFAYLCICNDTLHVQLI